MRLDEVREEIHDQLGLDNVPITFIFLRSVGRNFTQVVRFILLSFTFPPIVFEVFEATVH